MKSKLTVQMKMMMTNNNYNTIMNLKKRKTITIKIQSQNFHKFKKSHIKNLKIFEFSLRLKLVTNINL